MQRAAASSPSAKQDLPQKPPNKRQKLADGSPEVAPEAVPHTLPPSETLQNEKLEHTLSRLAAEAGDEKWTLRLDSSLHKSSSANKDFCVTHVGYNAIDSGQLLAEGLKDDLGSLLTAQNFSSLGRKSFGNFRKQVEVSFYRKMSE